MRWPRLCGVAKVTVFMSSALALTLAGCTNSPGPHPSAPASSTATTAPPSTSPTPTPSDTTAPTEPEDLPHNPQADAQAIAQIKWTEDAEGIPTLEFEPPLFVTGATARLIKDGDGALISEGDTITFDYVMFAGDTGQLSFSTFAENAPATISVRRTGMSQTLSEMLIGSHVGAKLIFGTIDSAGLQASDFLYAQFMAVIVKDARTPLERATGQSVKQAAWLPGVTLADNGQPSINLPIQAGAPHELISQLLIRGEGPLIEEDQTVIVKFSAWTWDGTEFDSTWQDNATMAWPMTQGLSMPGLLEGLINQRVGSQILLIIPPDKAFGDVAMTGVPPGSTMVYVVDILDVQ